MGKKKLARFFLVSVSIIFGLLLVSSVCYAIPPMINYQGYLTDSVGNPLNGTVDIVFSIYDVDIGGDPHWTETQTGVVVTDGLFSVNLGEVNPITLSFDDPYWLGVTVGTDSEMTPRQPITSVGYAYRAGIADAVTAGGVESDMLAEDAVTADKIDDGAVQSAHLGLGAVTTDKLDDDAVTSAKILDNTVSADDIADGPGSLLDADTLDGYDAGDFILLGADNWVDETGDTMTGQLAITVASGMGLSSITASDVNYTPAIFGYATASTGATYGVWGYSASTSGYGLYGYASAPSGYTRGVYGDSDSTEGFGVYGSASASSGETYGVYGQSDSTGGYGVYGYATANSGLTYGVVGQSDSTQGSGVAGLATTSSGYTFGVLGRSNSTSGRGVYGRATASTGTTYGVYGSSLSTDGVGVYGYSTASNGTTYGVRGESSSTSGRGVYGEAPYMGIEGWGTASTGSTYGVYGRSASTAGRGVSGYAYADTGTTYGVRGESSSTSGRGVFGWASASSGTTYGVLGWSNSTSGRGVFGYATADTGTTYGVYGVSPSHDGYGGYFRSNGIGIYAYGGPSGYAADFLGNVRIRDRISGDTVMELGTGLDYAEGFDVSHNIEITPGSVLIIDSDNPGKLTMGGKPYDTKVAGIVAGANGTGSGVRLGAGQFDYDVALAGRVYCNVDASEVGVEPGDLLTTSGTPGYAMKATDYGRAQGAILGKAMQKLEKGQKGQILVLVTLQ